MEGLRYTIINEKTGSEAVLDIVPEKDDQYSVSVFNTRLYIGRQQLFELGWLFIALASEGLDKDGTKNWKTEGISVDEDSAKELLDGYGIPVPDALENWKWVQGEKAAMFYSVWDDGEVLESPATVKDGEVTVLKSHDKDDDATLEREYIVFVDDNDEEEHEVCTQCHEHLLKIVLVDDPTGAGQHEEEQCPECDA